MLLCFGMIIIALVLSLVFGALGFIVTENNAKYILSGYNTMSEQDRQQFDIVSYVKLFKRFHLILAATLFGGVCLLSLVNNNWASLFMTVFPLAAYLYFLIRSAKYHQGKSGQKAGAYIVGGVLVVVIAVLLITSFSDYKSSELTLGSKKLEIKGSYGVTLDKGEIREQKVVNELPSISHKSNGFAAGDYAKGRFETSDGNSIWLFVNKKASHFLLIRSSKGDIYYSHDEMDMQQLSRNVAQWLAPKL